MNEGEKLDLLINASQVSGLTIDALYFLISGLDDSAVAILLGNVSMLPKYMKSRDVPYLACNRIAPSIEMRKSPLSHWE